MKTSKKDMNRFYKSIRKPTAPPTKPHEPNEYVRSKSKNWRDFIDEDEYEEEEP